MTITPDRLNLLDGIHLDKSSHTTWADGHCAMEVAAWLAGEPHSDTPVCVSPPLRSYMIGLNDAWPDGQRQLLKPFIPRTVGTSGDGQDEARSYLALDWLIRSYTPAWLDLAGLTREAQSLRELRRIVDVVAAREAGPVVRTVQSSAAAAGAAAWAARDAVGAAAWAAGDAVGDAAWDAAWAAVDFAKAAAWAAAGAAAWAAGDAVGDAVGAAAWAAGDAVGAATGDAAWAAGDALQPTVKTLQASALQLLDAMINPAEVPG